MYRLVEYVDVKNTYDVEVDEDLIKTFVAEYDWEADIKAFYETASEGVINTLELFQNGETLTDGQKRLIENFVEFMRNYAVSETIPDADLINSSIDDESFWVSDDKD